MGYNQFSKLVTNAPQYKAPISEDTLVRGAAYQEQGMQKIKSELQSAADSFLNIQAMSPQDEEIMNQRKKEFQESVKGLNMASLSNPQTLSQANSIISKFANDPDIQGIAQRSAALKQDQSKQKEYEMKGLTYNSPLQRQAQKYIQDGNYYRDTRFNKSGYVAPDNKDIHTWANEVPEWKKYVENGVYDDKQEGKAVGQLYSKILQNFQNDPKWQNLHKDNFEQSIEGQDLYSYINQPTEAVAQLFPHLPEGSLEQQKAIQTIEELKSLGQNPYAESAIKNRMEDLYIRDQASMAAQAEQYTNTTEHKWNEVKKDATDFAQAKYLAEEHNKVMAETERLKAASAKELNDEKIRYMQEKNKATEERDKMKFDLQIERLKAEIKAKEQKAKASSSSGGAKKTAAEVAADFSPTSTQQMQLAFANSKKDPVKVKKIKDLLNTKVTLADDFDEEDIENVAWDGTSKSYKVKLDVKGWDSESNKYANLSVNEMNSILGKDVVQEEDKSVEVDEDDPLGIKNK